MSQTLLIEMAGDPNTHYVVTYSDHPQMKSWDSVVVIQYANLVIDANSGEFLKSRYIDATSRLASIHEMEWFMRGNVHHVSIEEMIKIVKNIHGDW